MAHRLRRRRWNAREAAIDRVNGPKGTYKRYRLAKAEYPRDPEQRLDWGKSE